MPSMSELHVEPRLKSSLVLGSQVLLESRTSEFILKKKQAGRVVLREHADYQVKEIDKSELQMAPI